MRLRRDHAGQIPDFQKGRVFWVYGLGVRILTDQRNASCKDCDGPTASWQARVLLHGW